jgi:ATP-dependent Clp protease ATP-binding subunit ClpB
LRLSDGAKALLAHHGYDPVYGARPLKRALQKEIVDPLALRVLNGDFADGDVVEVDVEQGEIAFHKGRASKVAR